MTSGHADRDLRCRKMLSANQMVARSWCIRYHVYTMSAPKHRVPIMKATMRDFRAAPAKLLRRAARTGAKLSLGEFVLSVREQRVEPVSSELYGAMANTGQLIGAASGLLSADDVWSADAEVGRR